MILNFTLDEETFWTKVDIRGPAECWDWMGAKAHGYGKYTLQNGMTVDARYIASGTVDYASLVWPVCGNRGCCNPTHLQSGTHEDRCGTKKKAGAKETARVERLANQEVAREAKMTVKLERAAARTVAREKRLAEWQVNKVKYNPLPLLSDTAIQKFWGLVDVQSPDDCWLWTGSRQSRSNPARCYGIFNTSNGQWRAHRISYFLATEHDPRRLYVCHSCDTPLCVNPQHLWLGTALDNHLDKVAKGHVSNVFFGVKLTVNNVIQIRLLLADGKFPLDIAKLYDVHVGTIRNIRCGKSWKHV